jgi:hypothetical protein
MNELGGEMDGVRLWNELELVSGGNDVRGG